MLTPDNALALILAHVDSRLGSGSNRWARLQEAEAVLRRALLPPTVLAEGLMGGWQGEHLKGVPSILTILVDYESTGSVQLDQRVLIVLAREEEA